MNAEAKRSLLAKLVGAVEAEGYANVRGRLDGRRTCTIFIVQGDCPCGLGTSSFSMALTDREHVSSRIADSMAQQMGYQARKHIEQDKAEGRWKD